MAISMAAIPLVAVNGTNPSSFQTLGNGFEEIFPHHRPEELVFL
jgi:hypothetical protein